MQKDVPAILVGIRRAGDWGFCSTKAGSCHIRSACLPALHMPQHSSLPHVQSQGALSICNMVSWPGLEQAGTGRPAPKQQQSIERQDVADAPQRIAAPEVITCRFDMQLQLNCILRIKRPIFKSMFERCR